MRNPRRWGRAALAAVERIPLLGWLQSGTRKGMLVGLLGGGLFLLLLGGLFGGLNRGPGGTLVGAVSGALCGIILGSIIGAIYGTMRFPQEGYATIAIELDNGTSRYAPGDSVTGTVQVTAENTLRIAGGKLYFICRGFYTYDQVDEEHPEKPQFARESRQYLVQQVDVIPRGMIRRGATQRRSFSFAIPNDALPTHHGYVCAVRWTLHAVLDLPDLLPSETHEELFVDAVPPTLQTVAGGYQSIAPSQVCQLTLILPRAAYAEGEMLTGRAHITPLESFRADEVRAVLLRIENTDSGDDHTVYVGKWDPQTGTFHGGRQPGGQGTTYVWLEGEVTLAGTTDLEIAESVTYPISLDIPAEWRPTMVTKDGRVTWKVGVIISRTGHSDIRAFHEVLVHTSVSQVAALMEPEAGFAEQDDPMRSMPQSPSGRAVSQQLPANVTPADVLRPGIRRVGANKPGPGKASPPSPLF